jgi:protein SCO1/2
MNKCIIIVFTLALFFVSCRQAGRRTLPYYNNASFTPQFLEKVPADFHKIRSFHLTTQANTVFTEQNMDGKISVVNFFFTSCPGICPRMAVNMKVLQDSFLTDNRIQLLSHSVMPETDDVPALAKYAEAKKVDGKRWLLLTGNKSEIYTLGRKFYFVEEDLGQKRDTSEFLHTENFVLVDKQRHIRGIYNGLNIASVGELIKDIRELEKE